ncbi:MAG: diguanylate cyclase [Treponema sp.]|jgi:diguanylate cyclase (GGDEF)-like protein|nr:diguanylate cyclase [Treponema sp.]
MIRNINNVLIYRAIIFSVVFFFAIAGGGSAVFFNGTEQFVHEYSKKELIQVIGNKQRSVENYLNREFELALRLASSPLIRRFFLDPENEVLRRVGIEEILEYQRGTYSHVILWASDKDKRYYEGDRFLNTYDPDNPAHAWYADTLNTDKPMIVNVDYDYLSQNRSYLFINVPVRDNGRGIGTVGTQIDLNDFLSFLYEDSSASSASNAELYLFNSKGAITGARNATLVAGDLRPVTGATDGAFVVERTFVDHYFGSAGKKIIEEELSLLNPDDTAAFVVDETQYVLKYLPSLDWYMLAVRPIDAVTFFSTPMTLTFLLMLLVILIIFIAFNFFVFTLIRPLTRLTGVLQTIFTATPNPIMVVDKQNRIIHMSKALFNMTNRMNQQACENQSVFDLFDNPDIKNMIGEALQLTGHTESISEIIQNERRKFFNVISDDIQITGDSQGRLVMLIDITTVMMYGLTDPLTGLANRRYFDIWMKDEWKRAIRQQFPISFLMMDIDHFKAYNDRYGHLQGDRLLKSVADVFKAAAKRSTDLAVRMGGEEFGLLLPNTILAGALQIAENIRSAVEKTQVPIIDDVGTTSVTISIGVASMVPTNNDKPEHLIVRADQYLYSAKQKGRNRVVSEKPSENS